MSIFKSVAGAGALAILTSVAADAETLRLATQAPEGSVWAKQIQRFADAVKASGTDLEIEIFWNGQLGEMGDAFKQTIMGRTDMWVGTTPFMASVTPEIGLMAIPFMFDDDAQAKCVIPKLEAPLREATAGKYQLLHIAPISTQDISAKKEIRVPADAAGLRIRTAPTEGAIAYYRSIGAVPQPMSPAEAPAALQTGLLDASDMEATFTILTGMDKLVPYHTPLSTVDVVAGYVVSPKTWSKLTDDQRAAMQAAADTLDFAADFDEVEAFDAQLLEKAKGEGLHVVDITPEEREQWRQAGLKIQPELIASIPGNTEATIAAINEAKASCK